MSEQIIRFQCEERGCTREAAVMGDPVGLEAIGWSWFQFGDMQGIAKCPEHRDQVSRLRERVTLLQESVANALRFVGLIERMENKPAPCKVCGTTEYREDREQRKEGPITVFVCRNCGARYSGISVR